MLAVGSSSRIWQTDQRNLGKLKKLESGRVTRLSIGGGKPTINCNVFGSDCMSVNNCLGGWDACVMVEMDNKNNDTAVRLNFITISFQNSFEHYLV